MRLPLLMTLTLLSGVAMAEAASTPRTFTPEEIDKVASFIATRLDEQLQLSDEQAAQVQPLYVAHLQALIALRDEVQSQAQGFASLRAARPKFQAQQAQHRAKMKEVLTPEQYRQFEALQAEMRTKMQARIRERISGGGGAPRGGVIEEMLNELTKEQRGTDTPAPDAAPAPEGPAAEASE